MVLGEKHGTNYLPCTIGIDLGHDNSSKIHLETKKDNLYIEYYIK